MIKIANRQYHVQSGESITVSVQATGTVHLVNSDLDGLGGDPLAADESLTFRVTNQTRVLTLLFTFSNDSGGSYEVTIESDQGGEDTDTVDQGSFGIPATATEYRFQL